MPCVVSRTSTCSLTAFTPRLTGSNAICSTTKVSVVRYSQNCEGCTVIIWSSAATPGMTASLVALDNSLRLAPVSGFLTVTSACGIAQPGGSVMFTLRAANCCGQSRIAGTEASSAKGRTIRNILGFNVFPSHDRGRGGPNTQPTHSTGAHTSSEIERTLRRKATGGNNSKVLQTSSCARNIVRIANNIWRQGEVMQSVENR